MTRSTGQPCGARPVAARSGRGEKRPTRTGGSRRSARSDHPTVAYAEPEKVSKSLAKKNRAAHTPKSYPSPSTLAAKKYEEAPEGHPTRPDTLATALGESVLKTLRFWANRCICQYPQSSISLTFLISFYFFLFCL